MCICTILRGENEHNDEMIINSKIYKVFAKNIIENNPKFTILNIVKGFEFLHRNYYLEDYLMKKFIAMLLALTMALALVACGASETPETPETPAVNEPQTGNEGNTPAREAGII